MIPNFVQQADHDLDFADGGGIKVLAHAEGQLLLGDLPLALFAAHGWALAADARIGEEELVALIGEAGRGVWDAVGMSVGVKEGEGFLWPCKLQMGSCHVSNRVWSKALEKGCLWVFVMRDGRGWDMDGYRG